MQGAITALQACQPYAMLPADHYGEWKVLDLSFTPQDFQALLDTIARLGSEANRVRQQTNKGFFRDGFEARDR